MKREELKAYRPYANRDGLYHKSEVDSVLDTMEDRIKKLEQGKGDLQRLLMHRYNRIKELEAENERLHQANLDCNAHFETLKEDYEKLKAQVPRWISVKDRLPTNGQYVLVASSHPSLYPIDVVCWSEYYIKNDIVSHWRPLPQWPTTEEFSATDKENG